MLPELLLVQWSCNSELEPESDKLFEKNTHRLLAFAVEYSMSTSCEVLVRAQVGLRVFILMGLRTFEEWVTDV